MHLLGCRRTGQPQWALALATLTCHSNWSKLGDFFRSNCFHF